jgi:hypothetical protein
MGESTTSEQRACANALPIKTSTLERFSLSSSFMKTDGQGLEGQVIWGGLETIKRCRPIVVMESPTSEIVRVLSQSDYVSCAWERETLVPNRMGSTNTIFIHHATRLAVAVSAL